MKKGKIDMEETGNCQSTQESYKDVTANNKRVYEHTFSCGNTLKTDRDDLVKCPYCGRDLLVLSRRNRGPVDPNTGMEV